MSAVRSILGKSKHWLLSDFRSFKEAPYKRLHAGSDLEKLSIIYPVYVNDQEGMNGIARNLLYYNSLSDAVKRKLNLVVVDDCSPVPVSMPDGLNVNHRLVRIDRDIKWNSGRGKNLGVFCCETSRMITADIDMLFPEETLISCMSGQGISDRAVYVFDEYLEDNGSWSKYGVHPNCFFMTKAAYLYLNGYDEDFCGHYGDDLYMNQWINKNMDVYNCGEKMFLTEGVNEVANKLGRKVGIAVYLLLVKKKFLPHSKEMLRFPWHLVC